MSINYQIILPEGIKHPYGIPEYVICGFEQTRQEFFKSLLERRIYAGEHPDDPEPPTKKDDVGKTLRNVAAFESWKYTIFTGELLGIWINPHSGETGRVIPNSKLLELASKLEAFTPTAGQLARYDFVTGDYEGLVKVIRSYADLGAVLDSF